MSAHKTTRGCSEADRERRRAQERKLTIDAVERLRSSDGWQQWLGVRRRFHRYSLSNQLLIAHQRPDATCVAGFRAWLGLGYAVRKGEHSLHIWAPVPPTRKQLQAWRDAGAKPDEKPRTWFRLAVVFDRSQVDPLPPPAEAAVLDPPIQPVEGDGLAPLLKPLGELVRKLGYTLTIEPLHGAEGRCEHRTHRVRIEEDLSANGQVLALLHELAHVLVKTDRENDDPTLTYAAEELVVESVAYSVAGTAGIDSSANSIPYLASWSERTPIETIQAHAALIDRLARRLEEAIAPETEPAAIGPT